ncbi:MAG: M1 family metallopeptidase, partial [Novosphingobium sp.]
MIGSARLTAAALLAQLLILPGAGKAAQPGHNAAQHSAASLAAAIPEAPIPLGKLPDAVKPLAYRLDLTLDPAQPRFTGRVEIDAQLTAPGDVVYLHGRDLAMRRAIALVGGKEIAGEWQQVDPTGVARLRFPVLLPAGPVRFSFEYDAAYSESPSGLFRVKVGEDWYGWNQFESIDARSAFPCFDEPGFKTPFAVTLRTPSGQAAVSNAPEVSVATQGGLDIHRFQPTLPLPTYLVAMMTGPFAMVRDQVSPSPQRAVPLPLRIISARPNADNLDFALAGSKPIVAALEAYFGEPFPFPKLDQISTPIMPGAMENAGADLYGDGILVMDGKASVSRQRQFNMIVAHELAHQWFGDLVTPAWWSDIWLNESFANWMGYHIASQVRPDLRIAGGGVAEGFAAMETDALIAGRPIRQQITANAQIDSSFDSITYGKGGQVIAMIASYMGEDTFKAGVRRYMAQHRFGNATSDDFFASLAEAAGDLRLVGAMRSFTDQQGVPLLAVIRRGDTYEVSQSRYAPLGANPPPVRWTIPLCARRGAARHCQLLTDHSSQFELPGKGPLVPNAEGAGYYRFELPRSAWDDLIAIADVLPDGEALAVADSLQASFRAGRASPAQLFALVRKLLRNPGSHASEAAGGLLDMLSAAQLIDNRVVPNYRSFLGHIYRPVLKKLGFDPRAGAYAAENPEIAQRRSEAVRRLINWSRDRKLRRTLAQAAERYFAGDAAALDAQWFDLAFDARLEYGALPAAKALGEKALASQGVEFRPAALAALGSSGSTTIATWLLNEWSDPRLRLSEQRQLLRDIMAIRATRETGYRWLRAHLDEL